MTNNNNNDQQKGRQGNVVSSESLRKIKEAARLRVEMTSWAIVSTRLGYSSADSARSFLTQRYPVIWQDEYQKAKSNLLTMVEAEAIHSQRELIRIDRLLEQRGETMSIKDQLDLRQRATHSLLAHSAKLQARGGDVNVNLTNEISAASEFDRFRADILNEIFTEEEDDSLDYRASLED